MIMIAGGLVLLTSLFITATLRLSSRPAFLVALYLSCYTNIVLAGEIANTFYVLNRQWAFLALHSVFGTISLLAWWRAGRPSLLGPFSNIKEDLKHKTIRDLLKDWPDLALLGLGILAILIYTVILNFVVPPNNNDSLSTHLSRIGYWLQHGSFFPWPSSRLFQLFYPVDSALQMFWTILFWGSDRLVGFVQWTAGIISAIGVFGIARLLGWKRSQAIFSTLVYLSFPLILLQLTTTQNDLVIAALFVSAIYFLLLGIKAEQRNPLILSAASMGLGLGTKQTIYFLLPGVAVLVLLIWRKFGNRIWRRIGSWLAWCVVFFVLFAVYMNIVNLRTWGNPFGASDSVSMITGSGNVTRTINSLSYSIPRIAYQALDTSGLPRPLDGYAHKIKSHLVQYLVDKSGFEMEGTKYVYPGHVFRLKDVNLNQEDHAWYGPLSVLILFPAAIYYLVKGLRTGEWLWVGLILNMPLFLLCFAILFPNWDPYVGRYFAPVVAVTAPFMAGLYPLGKKWNIIPRFAAIGLALLIAFVTILCNPAKQVAGKRTTYVNIWSDDRIAVQTIQNFESREMLHMVEDKVPADATLGLYTPGYVLDYPMFGEYFTRRLIPIYPFNKIQDARWLESEGIQYILVQESVDPEPILPPGLKVVQTVKGWSLYTWIDQ